MTSMPVNVPAPPVIWRRRLVVVLAVLTVAVLAKASVGGVSPGPGPSERMVPASQHSYVVRPGDTLWAIARSLEPRGDVRPVVDRLAQGRRGRPLRVGERIVLP